MEQLTKEQRLGNTIRQLRLSCNLTTDWVAYRLGYTDKSTYCKFERGEIKDVSVWKIIELCELFECNIVQLFFLAGVDVFKTKIKSCAEFNESLSKNDNKNIKLLKKLLHPPPNERQKKNSYNKN